MKKTFTCAAFLFVVSFLTAQAQVSALLKDFKQAKKNGTEAILPDFSYAGYHYSEKGIPDVNYKKFNVTDFGAKPNDEKSDKDAIQQAIKAATKNGEGVIYFPKGKYAINTDEDDNEQIIIPSSKIVFRGEGEQESILFFKNDLPPADPKKLWTVPFMIQTEAHGARNLLANVTGNARRETFSVKVDRPSKLKKGDWVVLKMQNNSKDLINYELQPEKPDAAWKSILNKGVLVQEKHQVKAVNQNEVTFYEPIHYDVRYKHGWKIFSYPHLEEVGFENLTFQGNWTKEFKHHRSAQDDGGWSILNLKRVVNSWIRNCRFKDVSIAAKFSIAAASTALNIDILGHRGHDAISAAGGSTGILLAKINNEASMWHSTGVGGGSTSGTVIWRCQHPSNTSFETHASQPRCTLFDQVKGGFFTGRGGGARQNLPNHLRYLVLWNYQQTGEPEKNFEFWASDSWYWKIVPPIVVGFHGVGTTFKKEQIQVLESMGKPVKPASLFEAQLKYRLGKLPTWIEKLN